MSNKRYAIIGAGPSGLAAARNLQRMGIAFRGFELHDSVGGLWDIKAPRSTVYESAHLISSKRMTEFTEFPMADKVADYPSHIELAKYFKSFAEHFDLNQYFTFNTQVIECRKEAGQWLVRWRTEQTDGSEAAIEQDYFDGVLIANGTLAEPNIPTYDGVFNGQIMHAKDYKSASQFNGKRVLVVGCGNSACDIAVDAVHHAKTVHLSVRRGYHFVPKYIAGKPADSLGGAIKLPFKLKQTLDSKLLSLFAGSGERFGLPKPDHKLYESHPVVNSLVLHHIGHGDIQPQADIEKLAGNTVHFKGGNSAEYDLLLLATGYKLHFPFMDRADLNWKGSAPHLYLNCFHPNDDSLFVIGMVEAAGLGWQGRYEQAELVARFIRAKDAQADNAASAKANAVTKFQQAKQEPFADMRGGVAYLKLDRMAFYVHKDSYRKQIAKHLQALS